ncbi:MAG: metallophosphoesterase [Candidatus Lokiarchaeota archaeon]|nr:metallophosphoesterase [Candidatus Lokiarchaeota archaeon]
MATTQKKPLHARYWKPVSIALAAGTALSAVFSAWVFTGGFWIWWASGYAAGAEVAACRPLIYGAWAFLFTCIAFDAAFWVKMARTRGRGHYRFAYASTIVILAASIAAFVSLGGGSVLSQPTPMLVMPGGDPSSEVVLACYTPKAQNNIVIEYELDGSGMPTHAFDRGDGISHRFNLGGLLPNSTYRFRAIVNSSSSQPAPAGFGAPRYFKTSPRNSSDGITFLSISDMHSRFPEGLAAMMASERADLVVEAGDLSDMGSVAGEWERYFQATSELYPGGSASVPAALRMPVMGNHDGMFFGRDNFGRFFRGVGSGPDSPFWYQVDAGDVHFIALDVEWGLETFTQGQEDWLQRTLAAIDPSDWIVVTTHCPLYSSGNNGEGTGVAARLAPIFEAGGVDLVISGHDHHYQRITRGTITYMITATVNPDTWRGADVPGSQAYITGEAMYGKYVIRGNSLDIYGMYANGTIADSATLTRP